MRQRHTFIGVALLIPIQCGFPHNKIFPNPSPPSLTMTKKRASPPLVTPPIRRHPWLGIQLIAYLSALAFILTLIWIQLYAPNSPPLTPLRFRDVIPFSGNPKIAFLFLTRAGLPLDFLWHAFFKNARVGNFSVYVHSRPGFKLDRSTTRSHFFYGRHVEDSVQVIWGESSMIEAERLLLREALEDPANQRFVLLSDSCVPLYNFDYVYNYLISSQKSYVDSFFDEKERRYNEKMAPTIPRHKWRKGSQWITLIRRHAEVIVDDDAIFPIFKQYCKRKLKDVNGRIFKSASKKPQSCIPDEHYVPTLLSMRELEDKLERRTLTYTLWNSSKPSWHPVTFKYGNANPQAINKIREINNVYYEADLRTEWCQCNGTFVPCFLFARKFSRGAALQLLSDGTFGTFDASSLLQESF